MTFGISLNWRALDEGIRCRYEITYFCVGDGEIVEFEATVENGGSGRDGAGFFESYHYLQIDWWDPGETHNVRRQAERYRYGRRYISVADDEESSLSDAMSVYHSWLRGCVRPCQFSGCEQFLLAAIIPAYYSQVSCRRLKDILVAASTHHLLPRLLFWSSFPGVKLYSAV